MAHQFLFILDDNDQPICIQNVLEWINFIHDNPKRMLIASDVVEGIEIYTEFTGANLAVTGPPALWQTTVNSLTSNYFGSFSNIARHYTSRVDAEYGHEIIVELIQRAVDHETLNNLDRSARRRLF